LVEGLGPAIGGVGHNSRTSGVNSILVDLPLGV
jgi:hypothetical protein